MPFALVCIIICFNILAGEEAELDFKVKSVLPSKDENGYLSIKWRTDVNGARQEAQLLGKPLFLWVMNGNPLGCT